MIILNKFLPYYQVWDLEEMAPNRVMQEVTKKAYSIWHDDLVKRSGHWGE
jgi:hypothetical protein